jgi:hypothetical protein
MNRLGQLNLQLCDQKTLKLTYAFQPFGLCPPGMRNLMKLHALFIAGFACNLLYKSSDGVMGDADNAENGQYETFLFGNMEIGFRFWKNSTEGKQDLAS